MLPLILSAEGRAVKVNVIVLICIVIAVNAPLSSVATPTTPSADIVISPQPFENSTEPELLDNPREDESDATDHPVKYTGAQLWRISYDDQVRKNAVADLQHKFKDVAMWNLNGTSVDMFLKKPVIADARKLLENAKVPFDVIIDDLQHAIDTENPPPEVIEQLQNRKVRNVNFWRRSSAVPIANHRSLSYRRLRGAFLGYNSLDPPMELWPDAKWGHRMTWSAYHRLSDIHGYLEYLANTYPELCSVQSIGNSIEGRPLLVLRISNGGINNKAVWIDGGIHAREWISPATVTYIIDQLVENREDQPQYVKEIDWYILPVANPDGYEYTHLVDRLWRKNRRPSVNGRCHGVDLNRNFGYHWGEQGASRQPCAETFAGMSAFSEPESLAQKQFFERSGANFQGYLSFHSYGQYILYPWGYDRFVPPDHKELERVGREAAALMKQSGGATYSVGPSGSLLYPASGGSDDWGKGSLGIKYCYTIELRDSGRSGFILPANQIIVTSKEAQIFTYKVAETITRG
ncbi:carboxypeptidase B-like isoform X1 [Lutzomyia longipalpis]|uniref:carboxypeptidase B-like isoform X1 n=1 Tax=Lutzomyia longipalpis TaxID=7200 RepID=UPI0024835D8D|nr:carboxypeptidase B-like isoform X1 [Lutzomyia longipalpis]